MPLPNSQMGVVNNPLLQSPFVQQEAGTLNSPPPAHNFLVTDSGQYYIFDNGNKIITD